jgi:hypothetical protein
MGEMARGLATFTVTRVVESAAPLSFALETSIPASAFTRGCGSFEHAAKAKSKTVAKVLSWIVFVMVKVSLPRVPGKAKVMSPR